MPQVGRTDAEFQRNESNFDTAMSSHQPCDPTPSADGRAQDEWQSLLERMRAAVDGEDRLQRVRHAIASGEFHVDSRAIAERLISRLLMS
jgi:anti-sigma28 factor (negative regulator of flagellin synthesis)